MKDNSYDQLLTLDQVVVQAGEYHLALTCLQDENKDTEQLLARTALMLTLGMIIKKTHHCFYYLQVSLKSEDKNNNNNKEILPAYHYIVCAWRTLSVYSVKI